MIYIQILFFIICFHKTLTLDISPDSRIPHAQILDDFLDEIYFTNNNESNSISVFDYLFGANFTKAEDVHVSNHLDISELTPENLKQIVEDVRSNMLLKSQKESAGKDNLRRYIYVKYDRDNEKAMSWMQQSIYGTRRRLEVTRPYRKKFQNDISYNIGILYGILKEMLMKAEALHTTLWRIHFHHYMVWFVFIYQRLLSMNVDMTYIIERLFEYQSKWNRLIGRKEKGESAEEGVEGGSAEANITMPNMGTDIWNDLPMELWPGGPGQDGGPGQGGGLAPGPPGQQAAPGQELGAPVPGRPEGQGSRGSHDYQWPYEGHGQQGQGPYGGEGPYDGPPGGPGPHGGPGSHGGPGPYL